MIQHPVSKKGDRHIKMTVPFFYIMLLTIEPVFLQPGFVFPHEK